MKKLRKRTKAVIVLVLLVLFVIFDLIPGFMIYLKPGLSSTDNHIIFRKLINIYITSLKEYDNLDTNEKKKYYRYIPDWDSIFKGKSRKFPGCWYDYDYIMRAPYSVNLFRRMLFRRKGEYLIFDLNKASEQIRNNPDTIIITEPFPQRGKRRVFRIKDIDSGNYDIIPEKLVQSQFKKQNWRPVIQMNYTIPGECQDECSSAKQILLKGFRVQMPEKTPLSNIKDNPYKNEQNY